MKRDIREQFEVTGNIKIVGDIYLGPKPATVIVRGGSLRVVGNIGLFDSSYGETK